MRCSSWDALLRCCEDGDLGISNNGAERGPRPVAVGQKNRMFFGSDNGGRTNAALGTLIAACKQLHIDPFADLRDLFQCIGEHPTNRLVAPVPDKWAAARLPANPGPGLLSATHGNETAHVKMGSPEGCLLLLPTGARNERPRLTLGECHPRFLRVGNGFSGTIPFPASGRFSMPSLPETHRATDITKVPVTPPE
jgi:hypothetical protein